MNMPAVGTYRETERRARKAHRCEVDCGQVIKSGQKYIEATAVWEGGWGRVRLHGQCRDLYAAALEGCDYDDGLAFQDTTEAAMEAGLLSPWQPLVEASEEAAA